MDSRLRTIGVVNGNFGATAGTIACGNAHIVNIQVKMEVNSSYEPVFKPVKANTGTASVNNGGGYTSDGGTYRITRPAGSGAGGWFVAWRMYNGATAAAGSTGDKYLVEKLG